MIDFDVRVQAPTLDLYRRQWTPAPDVALAGMWIGAVVADASGETYFGLRGADDFLVGMTHVVSPITGFKKLPADVRSRPAAPVRRILLDRLVRTDGVCRKPGTGSIELLQRSH